MIDLDVRARRFGGWSDVDALLAAFEDVPSEGPDAPVDIEPPPAGLAGQTGIRMREALAAGDARTAASLAGVLDEAHRIELLLGAALRDARGGFAAARVWMATEAKGEGRARWWPLCRLLVEGEADHTLDDLASAYVAEGRVPDRWRTGVAMLEPVFTPPCADVAVATALASGIPGDALLDAFVGLPAYPAVAHYYRRGTIHALGPRPLLILAASAG
jgi:hypothetical protein